MKKATPGRPATGPSLASRGATAKRNSGKSLSPRLTGSATGRSGPQVAGKMSAPKASWKGSK